MRARQPANGIPPSASAPVRITAIGGDGDGLAATPDGKSLFLADTLPGELVLPGRLVPRGGGFAGPATLLEPSPARVAPACPHFGSCGGCTLQHWADAPYAAWKAARAGLDPATLARTPPLARRRMDLALRRDGKSVRIGLHRNRSPDIVDMQACPVLHPTLFALVQSLRPVAARLDGLRRQGEASVNLLDSGPDLLLRTDRPLSAADRGALADFARAQDLPRVSWSRLGARDPEPAAALRPATHAFSGWRTELPPGAFLQASAAGEAAIVAATLAALPDRLRGGIVELFAGCGTLSHALSARAPVAAYEGDPASVAALRRAGNPRVTATVRDLARQPLRAAELKGAGAVVLDPPYAGAGPQMPALAESGVPVVYVSCNPGALVRDARALLAAGYVETFRAAADQFLWSTQVETIAGFAGPPFQTAASLAV